MDNKEIIALCANAMGYAEHHSATDKLAWTSYDGVLGKYDPLTDDAQLMALVKKFPYIAAAAIIKEASTAGLKPNFNYVICSAIAELQMQQLRKRNIERFEELIRYHDEGTR